MSSVATYDVISYEFTRVVAAYDVKREEFMSSVATYNVISYEFTRVVAADDINSVF